MICSCSTNSQRGEPDGHPANIGCSYWCTKKIEYTKRLNRYQRKKTDKKRQQKRNRLFFKSNLTQIVYEKRMKKILTESANFNTS